MDPIRLLKHDHKTIKTLFRKIAKAERKSERQKLGEEIIEELSVHAAIEEQLVYPMLRKHDKRSEEAALNALEEHHAAKLILAELDKMHADDERYAAKIHVLTEMVESHIEEEEEKLLPKLERVLDDERSKQLADLMVMMRKAAPNHPHPDAPDEPPGNLVAAMIAKMGDAGKDLLRTVLDTDKADGHRRITRRAESLRHAQRATRGGAQPTRRAATTH